MEIERKFLMNGFPDLPEIERAHVMQGYLSLKPEIRIRSKQVNNQPESYQLCIKSEGDLVREEIELDLNENDFRKLAAMLPKSMICKDYRVYELDHGLRLECSHVDPGSKTEFYYAEVEFSSELEAKRFCPPDFLGEEVTWDSNYRMKAYYQKKT